MNEAERRALFRYHLDMLGRYGERAVAFIESTYGTPAERDEIIELAAKLDDASAPADPPVIPSEGTKPGQAYCDWCGRHDGETELQDESAGGPAVHTCQDLQSCLQTHDARLDYWAETWRRWYANHPGYTGAQYTPQEQWNEVEYPTTYQPYAHVSPRMGGWVAELSGQDEDAQVALAALSAWREVEDQVTTRAAEIRASGVLAGLIRLADEPDDVVTLAAPETADADRLEPVATPSPIDFGRASWSHVLGRSRQHTVGHRHDHPHRVCGPQCF